MSNATQSTTRPTSDEKLLLAAENISKRYGSVQALDGATLTLRPGEIHGLCGHNGAGKSTLVKVLTGLVQADSGEVTVDGASVSFRSPLAAQAAGITLVDQELSLAPDLSVEENIFLGQIGKRFTGGRQGRELAVELLDQVGLSHVDPRTLAERLPLGERQLVEIARAVGRGAKIVLLDEPTATLSESEIERVFEVAGRLVADGKSLIYISHRLGEVLELCDRVTVMRDGRTVTSRSCSDIDHRDELIQMMIGAELSPPEPHTSDVVRGEVSTEIRHLHVPPLVRDFNLALAGGEIVGLTGQVGAGPSEVLRALAGLDPDAYGDLLVNGERVGLGSPRVALKAGVAFASNDRKGEGVFLQQPVRLNLLATRLDAISRLGFLLRRRAATLATHLASFVKVDPDRLPSLVATLSGGNQQKVFLGRCLDRGDVALLLLDEPTRGVDVAGRAEIHELLREAARAGTAVVFASTEVDEILDLSHRVVTMFAGRVVATRSRAEVTAGVLSADMTMSREHLHLEVTRSEIAE